MRVAIDVPLDMDDGVQRCMPGTIADIAPHLAKHATFAVHQARFYPDTWQVTNIESGRMIGRREDSRTAAVNAARRKLAKVSEQKLLAAYRKCKVR